MFDAPAPHNPGILPSNIGFYFRAQASNASNRSLAALHSFPCRIAKGGPSVV